MKQPQMMETPEDIMFGIKKLVEERCPPYGEELRVVLYPGTNQYPTLRVSFPPNIRLEKPPQMGLFTKFAQEITKTLGEPIERILGDDTLLELEYGDIRPVFQHQLNPTVVELEQDGLFG